MVVFHSNSYQQGSITALGLSGLSVVQPETEKALEIFNSAMKEHSLNEEDFSDAFENESKPQNSSAVC